jgi:uncharacterized protein (TIGR04255 family)
MALPDANQSEQVFFMPGSPDALAPFFEKFSREIAQHFPASERLVPVGYPLIANQAAHRFRPAAIAPQSALYQVGPGIFTANALPPYKAWQEFVPIIEEGVRALLESRVDIEKELPFSYVGLRYIDAFNRQHTGDRSVADFMCDVLGIDVKIPQVITKYTAEGAQVKPALQLQIPMEEGMVMNLSVAEGMLNGELVVLMDTTVATTALVPSSLEAIMDTLASAHDIIHDVFFGLTEKIKDEMQPVEV